MSDSPSDTQPTTLPPLSDADWPADLADLKDGFAGKLNVYRVMAHHPDLLRGWEGLRRHVVLENALGAELSEIVILRVGHRLGSPYERAHHLVRAEERGVSPRRIAEVADGGPGLTDDDRLLVAATDALLAEGRLPPELRDRLGERFGWQPVLDVMATVGMYATLAFIANSFDTPVDADLAGHGR